MKDISDVTCCVVDSGLFLQMARRMAEDCKRVLYWNPDVRAFPSLKQGVIGDGFPNVERVQEFWPYLDDIDLFCFPDSALAGLQIHLEQMGKAVWGSRNGQNYEQRRKFFMDTLEKLGLDVPPYQVVNGLDALRDHLFDAKDKFIKISHWRGDMETKHWRSRLMDEGWLDYMAYILGPVKNKVPFLVFDQIDTDLELGADLYAVDDQYPSHCLNGVEGKDKCYFSAVTRTDELPHQILSVLHAFSPLLKACRYRNQMSLEIRVTEDRAYPIDATKRGGMPSTASQHLLWKNFPKIVWAGANGEMVNPELAGWYSVETMITAKPIGCHTWDAVFIPEEIEPYCRFSNCCLVDGVYAFPPDEIKGQDLGWLCAIGDSPKEAFDNIKVYADELPDGLNADVEALADIIKEVQSAHEQGITITDEPMPEPATVLEET